MPNDLQPPFDAAVVTTTVLRPELKRAVFSVYEQDLQGRIQILVGIDKPLGERAVLDALERERPPNCALTVLDLGYSTAERNGGLYSAGDGGALRTMLSFAANSPYVAYLDDDNWWTKNHLSSLKKAIHGKAWVNSLRWLVDEVTMEPVSVDEWHSVGSDRGEFAEALGGFADPSTLMIDKLKCSAGLHLWCFARRDYKEADRRFFGFLRQRLPGRCTDLATVYYVIRRNNKLWRKLMAAGIEPRV